jgi:ABC-type multidrug transport system permease subunit
MIGAGILIVTKQGDPVTSVITLATSLFGGVLFPITVMPFGLQIISYLIPQYYFFDAIRFALTGSNVLEILPQIAVLAIMCAIIVPLGYLVYSWCLKKAKKNGTLAWF